jgi:hypothetical protein
MSQRIERVYTKQNIGGQKMFVIKPQEQNLGDILAKVTKKPDRRPNSIAAMFLAKEITEYNILDENGLLHRKEVTFEFAVRYLTEVANSMGYDVVLKNKD